MRPVESFISESSARVERVPCDPVEPGFEGAAFEHLGRAFAPGDVDAGRGERWRDAPRVCDAVSLEPVDERLLPIRHGQGIGARSGDVDLASERVEGDELLGRQ